MKSLPTKSLAVMLLLGQYKCSETGIADEIAQIEGESWNERVHNWVEVESSVGEELLQTTPYNDA